MEKTLSIINMSVILDFDDEFKVLKIGEKIPQYILINFTDNTIAELELIKKEEFDDNIHDEETFERKFEDCDVCGLGEDDDYYWFYYKEDDSCVGLPSILISED